MKFSSLVLSIAFCIGFFQHGCGNADKANQSSASNQNSTAILLAPTPSTSVAAAPLPEHSSNTSISLEEDRKFNSFRELCKHAPVAMNKVRATHLTGTVPLKVTFDGGSAYDPDGTKIVKWEWHFGNWERGEGRIATYIYDKPGKYSIGLNVTDSQGQKTSDCSDLGTGIEIIASEKEN